ncbi:hypothetical protein GCM10010129_00470 [Streptomyces fumigatiscleroticus]|nr:hypothetical protein GCM10010129_00470 [Streptomyces fumigatiscleroticus]
MDPLLDELAAELRDVSPRTARIPMRSTVVDGSLDGTELDASYWTRNLRGRVRFLEATVDVAQEAETTFVEISPHPLLVHAVRDTLEDARLPGHATGSLLRGEPERETLLNALGTVYGTGADIDWSRLYGSGRCVPLPAYPWQRESHWLEDLGALPEFHDFPLDPGSPFLMNTPAGAPLVVHGPVFTEVARLAAARTAGADELCLTDVEIKDALTVPPGETPLLRVGITRGTTDRSREFEVAHRPGGSGPWRSLCCGTVTLVTGDRPTAGEPVERTMSRCTEHLDAETFHHRFVRTEECFRVVEEVWLGQGEVIARLRRPPRLPAHPDHPVHPVLLAAAAQPALALLPDASYVAEGAGRVTVTGPQTDVMWSRCRLGDAAAPDRLHLDVTLLDAAGGVVLEATGLRMSRRPDAADEEDRMDKTVRADRGADRGQEPAPAARRATQPGIELTGDLRLTDPASGLLVELHGSLRVSRDSAGPEAAAHTAPAVGEPVRSHPASAPEPPPATTAPDEVPPGQAASPESARGARSTAGAQPAAAPRERPIAEQVSEHVAAVLRMPVDRLDVNRPLDRLGMDSLMAAELRKRLEKNLGVRMAPNKLVRGTATADLVRECEAHTTA